MRRAEVNWLPFSLLGVAAVIVANEWARSRREGRKQSLELQRNQAHREGYHAGYMAGLDIAAGFRARSMNQNLGSEKFYGFSQCCRGCRRPYFLVLQRRSEYWTCGACGTVNASPLPKEVVR